MKSARTWNWLVPRFVGNRMQSSSSRKVSRPCLAVERLEDRDMLSASSIGTGPPPSVAGDTQVLISLLQGGLKVTQDEFQLLKILGTASPTESKGTVTDIQVVKVVDKATPVLMQLSDTLVKVGEDLIKGNLTDKKLAAAESKIQFLEVKLQDVIISSVVSDSQQQALRIVDSLFADASSLVQGMIGVQAAGDTPTESLSLNFSKVAVEYQQIQKLTIEGELDFIKGQSPGLTIDDFTAKIENDFQKANDAIIRLGPATSDALLPAVQEFHDGIFGLLGSLGDGGNFGGGIVVPPSDDIIT